MRLGAKTNVIESREEEDLGDKYAVRIVYAIPKEIHDELVKWRNRTWKRIRRRPSVQWGPLNLFPPSEYEEVQRILEEAREEFEEIVAQIPDEELREKLSFNPTIVFVTPAPGFESGFDRQISDQVLQRIEEALSKTTEYLKGRGDYEVEERLSKFQQAMEREIKKLREEMRNSHTRKFLEVMKRIETLLATVATSKKLGKRDINRIRRALEEAEKFSDHLAPEVKRTVDRMKEQLENIQAESISATMRRMIEELGEVVGGED